MGPKEDDEDTAREHRPKDPYKLGLPLSYRKLTEDEIEKERERIEKI